MESKHHRERRRGDRGDIKTGQCVCMEVVKDLGVPRINSVGASERS